MSEAGAMTGALPDFPMPRGSCPFQQHPDYTRLQARGPISKVSMAGREVWFVTGYAEVRALFADQRLSVDRTNPGYPGTGRPGSPSAEELRESQSFNQLDDPEHAVFRRMVLPSLTVRRVRAMRPEIQADADHLVERLLAAGPPGDLAAGVAVPLPAMMLARLYGVPEEDRPFFEQNAQRAATDRRNGGKALRELSFYVNGLLRAKLERPGKDLASALAAGTRVPGVTHRRLLNVSMQTLVAGNESTLSMISMGVLVLLAHPEQWNLLRADPAALPGAIEELLRYLSVADSVPRVATTDIEVAGELIRAGDGVLLATPAANRDAEAFPDPDRLDIGRARSRHHVAFGYGIHQCVGQNLARAALECALVALLAKVPGLRLAVPPDEVRIDGGVGVHRITRLPVTWEVPG